MSVFPSCIAAVLLWLGLFPASVQARTDGFAADRAAAGRIQPARERRAADGRRTGPSAARIAAGRKAVTARARPGNPRTDRGPRTAGLAKKNRLATPAGDGFDRMRSVSLGDAIGLHRTSDPLDLRSGSVLVMDRDTGKVLYSKNRQYVLPIASLTKVMTSMVVIDGGQSLDETITVTAEDRDLDRFSSSRLPIGTSLTRREMIVLALMASENRAASALARSYPGGLPAFVLAANRKARELGMPDSTFADGTGLSAMNVSTADDLARMIAAAGRYPLIREASVSPSHAVRLARGERVFHTTNRLIASPAWQLDLQKTGYISEAGNCLVLLGKVERRSLIVVLLDSYGRHSRLGDAERIRRWLATQAT
jgi:D-alanyl-D-alanine endopeptidase (penicillin-binding protein 7)